MPSNSVVAERMLNAGAISECTLSPQIMFSVLMASHWESKHDCHELHVWAVDPTGMVTSVWANRLPLCIKQATWAARLP